MKRSHTIVGMDQLIYLCWPDSDLITRNQNRALAPYEFANKRTVAPSRTKVGTKDPPGHILNLPYLNGPHE